MSDNMGILVKKTVKLYRKICKTTINDEKCVVYKEICAQYLRVCLV